MENFDAIVHQYHPLLYKTGRAFTATEADFEDLYQEMLIQLWQALGHFKGQSAQSTFVYRVVLNTAMTHRRKAQRQPMPQALPPELPQAEEGNPNQEQQIALLYEAIHALPAADRSLMLLHLEGKSYKEMAEILGLTTSHVGVKISRAKKLLSTELTRLGYER